MNCVPKSNLKNVYQLKIFKKGFSCKNIIIRQKVQTIKFTKKKIFKFFLIFAYNFYLPEHRYKHWFTEKLDEMIYESVIDENWVRYNRSKLDTFFDFLIFYFERFVCKH